MGMPEYVLERGGGRSTYDRVSQVLDLPECFELQQWLIEQSKVVWNLWGLQDLPRYAGRSWFNWHPKGAWTDEHDHGPTHMVMAMYINQPANGGNIQFKDPSQYCWSAYPKAEEYGYDWRTIAVETGDVLFFPGFMRHRTEVNESDDDRIVLSANITIDFFGRYSNVV
jgi:uncharacterized protein (TIGR02466 family)